MADHRDEVAELFEEAGGRGREWFDGEGFSFSRLGSLEDAAFQALCAKLQQDNWRRSHPEKVREYRARAETKPERKEYRRAWKKKDRDAKWETKATATCSWCQRQFKRKRVGRTAKTCSQRCCWNVWYHRRNPTAPRRGLRNRRAGPA